VEGLVSRDERIMHLLVEGVAVGEVARRVGLCGRQVRNIRKRMCAVAEKDGQLARLKLATEYLRRAA
jgi:DNA-binding NarL/FixJ family response regulator